MRSFSQWILSVFASPIGIVALAFLDSTLFFSLPLGIDAAVILLAARLQGLWWTVPLLATVGSLGGAALTFWMGVKIGENGLDSYIPHNRLDRVRRKVKDGGTIALAVLDLLPPPFPFTPFVLAAGALEVKPSVFFGALAVCRLFRFGLEAALARTYGPRLLALMDSNVFHEVVTFLIVVAAGLTILSVVRLFRSTRAHRGRAAA
jgi:membrane protein YqaA with SNARE-associated domain